MLGVEIMKTLTILLLGAPYSSQYPEFAIKIAKCALDRGYKVNMFLYGDGVHAGMKNQSPKAFYNIENGLKEIAQKGATILSCSRCSAARGYVEGEFDDKLQRYPSSKIIDEVRIFSLYGFVDFIRESDRIITFGGV